MASIGISSSSKNFYSGEKDKDDKKLIAEYDKRTEEDFISSDYSLDDIPLNLEKKQVKSL